MNGNSNDLYREEIQYYLLNNVRRGAKVLDVGAGSGTYAKMLNGTFDIDAIEAFEKNAAYLEKSKLYDKIFNDDATSFSTEKYAQYDCVILGDVLEHMHVEHAISLIRRICSNVNVVIVKVPFMYKQGILYDNEYEIHYQDDLTPEIMADRYPELDALYVNEHCGVYVNKRTNHTVCAELSTYGRYFSTLPMTLMAIACQNRVPDKLIIYDDNENPMDLRNDYRYKHIFGIFARKRISWVVNFTNGRGQVLNHSAALREAHTKYVWRLDDDCVPEPNVLAELLAEIKKSASIGAVSCKVHHADSHIRKRRSTDRNKIRGVFNGSVEWTDFEETITDAEHLYSTFLFNREHAVNSGGYCLELSKVGHCEETIFTNRMFAAGHELRVIPRAVVWHVRCADGGIRDAKNKKEMWDSDYAVFEEYCTEKYGANKERLFVIDGGIGDHYAFLSWFNTADSEDAVVACFHPEIFKKCKARAIHINDLHQRYSEDVAKQNVYAFMSRESWRGTLRDAYAAMHGK